MLSTVPAPPAFPLPGLVGWRVRRALTQEALAAESGVSRIAIARIESGKPARLGTIRKLAQALNVEPDALRRAEES